jgi:hypothetical protein
MTTFFQYQERIGLVWCKQIEGSERHRSESRLCQSLIESWLYRLPPAWLVELHYRQHPSQLELCYQLAVWTSDPNPKMNVEEPRRRLAPSEKYEIYVAVLTGQATQREAAERFGVDRSTVVHVCRTAKQGALAALAEHWPPRCRAGRGSRWRRPRWRRLERRWSAAGHRHRAGGGAAPAPASPKSRDHE